MCQKIRGGVKCGRDLRRMQFDRWWSVDLWLWMSRWSSLAHLSQMTSSRVHGTHSTRA